MKVVDDPHALGADLGQRRQDIGHHDRHGPGGMGGGEADVGILEGDAARGRHAEASRRLAPALADGRAALLQAPLDGDWSALLPGSFDLVTITLVLEHQPRVAPVLTRVAPYLRPGGTLFVAEIHPDMLRADLGGHFQHDGVTYALPSHAHDRAEFETALAEAGFADIAFDEMRADADAIAAIPKLAKRAGSGVLLSLRASRR